jgi:hypothetical protein
MILTDAGLLRYQVYKSLGKASTAQSRRIDFVLC